MADYDFKTLSSLDFELLVRDLLQAELKLSFESFKSGRDSGIDLRFATTPENHGIVVQCKHFSVSGYRKLVNHMTSSERPKIERLRPLRYILATSAGMTPANKDGLVDAPQPFCNGPHDAYSRDDLNNLLGKHPEFERQHFKLWLGSSAVLERIVHSQIYNYSETQIDEMRRKAQLYVQNPSFVEAMQLLHDLRYCIVCGIPGIGKTMLADILVIEHLARGYEAILVSRDIGEAFSAFHRGRSQIFCYDDFRLS